jgi:hypothetical protein
MDQDIAKLKMVDAGKKLKEVRHFLLARIPLMDAHAPRASEAMGWMMALDVLILMSALKRQDVNVQNVSAKTHGVVMIASAPVAFSIFTNMTFASVRRIHHPKLGGLFHS